MALREGKSWRHYVQVPGSDGALGHVVVYFTEHYDEAENYSVITATGGVVNHSTKSGGFGLNLSAVTSSGIVLLESENPFVGTVPQVGTAGTLAGDFPQQSGKIYHSANGECSITVKLEVISMAAEDGSWEVWNTAGSMTVTLTKILRPSTVSSAEGTIGSELTLNILKADSGYTHSLRYVLGLAEGTIVDKTAATSVRWTPPMELCGEVTDSGAGSCVLLCDSYDGTNLIGTTETVVRLAVPDTIKPAVSEGWVTVRPYNMGTAAEGTDKYVQGMSRSEAVFDESKIDLSGTYGATVKHFSISAEEITVTAEPYRTAVLEGSGTVTVRCGVTDSRGRTVSESFTIIVEEHGGLRITEPEVYRCIEDGTADDTGSYAAVRCAVSGSEAGGAVTLRCRMKLGSGEYGEYIPMEPNVTAVIGDGLLSTESTYIVEISAYDTLGNTAKVTEYVPTSAIFFHGRDGGKGAAFGKYAEEDNVLDVAWELRCPSLRVGGMTLEEYILAVVNGTAADEGSEG